MNTTETSLKKIIIAIFLGLLFTFIIIELSLRLFAFDPNTFSFSRTKPNRGYTIMALGNSHTYGIGAPMGQDYPRQLGRMLNAASGNKYHVINRGLRNINSTFIAENLEGWLKEDRPKLVFLMVGEPNYWNRYGYWNFLKERNKEDKAGELEKYDFLRIFSTYKLIELLLNREESKLSSYQSDHSNTFKGYKKSNNPDDMLYLGYIWLGSLEESDNFDFRTLQKEQAEEAITMLKYVWEKDRNPIAARLIADYFFRTHTHFNQALDYLEKAIDTSENYCLQCGFLINNLLPRSFSTAREKILVLQKKLNSKPGKVNYRDMIEFVMAVDTPKLSKDERIKLAENLGRISPGSMKALNIIYHAGSFSHPQIYINALKRTIRANPFAATGDLVQKAYSLRDINPKLEKESDEILEMLNKKFNNINFKEIMNINKLVSEWVLRDLEKMIELIHKSGAKAIVQTYPRVKSGPPRKLDDTLRQWWKNRKDKKDIEFLDIELLLNDKFKNGGDFYYATQLGPNDNHVNEHGYQEIAKLMVPLVPVVR